MARLLAVPGDCRIMVRIVVRLLQSGSILNVTGYANPRAYVAAQAQQVYAPVVAGPSTAEAQPLDEVGTQDDSLQGSLVQGGEGNGEMLLDPGQLMLASKTEAFLLIKSRIQSYYRTLEILQTWKSIYASSVATKMLT